MGTHLNDFSETAALIEEMDLIISVDTSVAHLAGAMGKPLWLLLPYAPDWRWLLNTEKSAWYPSAHLFRQPKFNDWDSVIKLITHQLTTHPLLAN
jgi:ADP-heptose:LPS heptosyltransferase